MDLAVFLVEAQPDAVAWITRLDPYEGSIHKLAQRHGISVGLTFYLTE